MTRRQWGKCVLLPTFFYGLRVLPSTRVPFTVKIHSSYPSRYPCVHQSSSRTISSSSRTRKGKKATMCQKRTCQKGSACGNRTRLLVIYRYRFVGCQLTQAADHGVPERTRRHHAWPGRRASENGTMSKTFLVYVNRFVQEKSSCFET